MGLVQGGVQLQGLFQIRQRGFIHLQAGLHDPAVAPAEGVQGRDLHQSIVDAFGAHPVILLHVPLAQGQQGMLGGGAVRT